jgi:hypothetical protein
MAPTGRLRLVMMQVPVSDMLEMIPKTGRRSVWGGEDRWTRIVSRGRNRGASEWLACSGPAKETTLLALIAIDLDARKRTLALRGVGLSSLPAHFGSVKRGPVGWGRG